MNHNFSGDGVPNQKKIPTDRLPYACIGSSDLFEGISLRALSHTERGIHELVVKVLIR